MEKAVSRSRAYLHKHSAHVGIPRLWRYVSRNITAKAYRRGVNSFFFPFLPFASPTKRVANESAGNREK